MAVDDLTKALLLEEAAPPRAVAEALFASVTGGVPLLQALIDTGAATQEVTSRYLARSEAPFLRHVVPALDLVERLPLGLCQRLLAIPVRHDAITGTIDVVVADAADSHPGDEIAFQLGAPVRLVRAPLPAIEEALRRLRMSSHEKSSIAPPASDRFYQEPQRYPPREREAEPPSRQSARPRPSTRPQAPQVWSENPPSVERQPRRRGLVIEADSVPPPALPPRAAAPSPAPRVRTPPWGTPIHVIGPAMKPPTEPPKSGYGSEIPIPLTRKTFYPGTISGGTQRPPALLVDPSTAGLGEGYAIDTSGLRDVVERTSPRIASSPLPMPLGSFIPGPPPLPAGVSMVPSSSRAPLQPNTDLSGIHAALRNAGSRDEVLELILTGARALALKVALFVVKKGGYLGWVGTSEFADRTALQSVLIPLDANSVFDRAVREDLYLGPIHYDAVHAPLLRIMKNPTRDIALVPVRVSGKTAVVIVADELADTMIGTRRLEELARSAGDAFARIVRTRR